MLIGVSSDEFSVLRNSGQRWDDLEALRAMKLDQSFTIDTSPSLDLNDWVGYGILLGESWSRYWASLLDIYTSTIILFSAILPLLRLIVQEDIDRSSVAVSILHHRYNSCTVALKIEMRGCIHHFSLRLRVFDLVECGATIRFENIFTSYDYFL